MSLQLRFHLQWAVISECFNFGLPATNLIGKKSEILALKCQLLN